MSDTTDTEKLEMIRKQGLARQTRYYQAHKEQILAKKQAEREQLKELNRQREPVVLPTEYTLDMIQAVFTEHITNINTLKKYNGDMKRVFTVSNLECWNGTIDTYNGVKDALEHSKYSLQTRRGAVQSILVFIDKSGILIDPKITAYYNVLYEVYGIKCTDANDKKKTSTDNEVMNYDTYMELVAEHYKTDSKQYLIASLYNECTCRDNFGKIKIITDLTQDDNDNNFIFLKNKECVIIMNNYKTSKIYGKQYYAISDGLTEIIDKYITKNNITDYLFPEQKILSLYVSNMNKKIGILGAGVNYLRHSKISTYLSNPDLTVEERHEFAIKSGHKEATQQDYKRIIIKVKGVLHESLRQYATDTIA
jgi:hypothetical protein